MVTLKTAYGEVSFRDDAEIKEKVFNEVLKFYIKHEAFVGEVIMQSDDCIIDAPEVLSDIADKIIMFTTNYDD
jgi:hypothetical protein